MNQLNEPDHTDMDAKIESELRQRLKHTQMMELEKDEVERNSKVTQDYENVRKLGFVTKRDFDEMVSGAISPQNQKIEALEKKIDILVEKILKMHARGQATALVEEQVEEPSLWKKWKSPSMKDLER